MTSMIDVIFKTGGVVDKLMGDGIMAFWGAPNDIENPSRAAIDCALKMLDNLRELQKNDPRFADLDIGIGISTGDVVVGNLGGEKRFDYSVIGDTVNFASRLEGLTRHFKVHLLVSRETYTEAGGGYIGRELGLVKVKGKQLFVPIVHVAGRENDSVDPAFYRPFRRRALVDSLRRRFLRTTGAPTAQRYAPRRYSGAHLPGQTRRRPRPSANRDGLRVRDQVTLTGSACVILITV